VQPPAGAPGGSGDLTGGKPVTPPAPAAAPGTPAAPPAERPLDQFPAEIRDYIGELRRESGDNRVKAKTAEQAAAEQLAAKQQEWTAAILKATGLMPDVADQAAAQLTPEQQVQALTDQLGQRDQDVAAREVAHREVANELAIWKAAHDHDADPQHLTDSRTFMTSVAGLDPAAADFTEKLGAAIAAAVEKNPHYKRAVVAQAAPPPPVASGADGFAGGTRGPSTEPKTTDEFRASLRAARGGSTPA
jgi:hypothetical protein